MTTIGFKEQFASAVENDIKLQSLRPANCINRKGCGALRKGLCDLMTCEEYEHRIKPGDTLQLYTGLMQRKYCKHKENLDKEGRCKPKPIHNFCAISGEALWKCSYKGAKLLKTATCTASNPIRFEDLTEEDARLDGFEKTCQALCDDRCHKGQPCLSHSNKGALKELKDFLIKTYDAKPKDVFQVIRWQ